MGKLVVCAIKDTAGQMFGQPFFTASRGIAERSFGDLVNSKTEKTMIASHPDDFELYHLGEFDDNSGEFKTKSPELIVRGKDKVISG